MLIEMIGEDILKLYFILLLIFIESMVIKY